MQQLEEYINVGTKRMRCGYTTGTCAAAASRAAAELLVRGELVPAVTVSTPAGIDVLVEIEEHESGDGWAQCAVQKDSGDDPDVTNGALVYARVERCDEPGIAIDGGIAFPHVRGVEGGGLCLAMGVSREGIDWDGQKVNLVFLSAIPVAVSAFYLRLMSGLMQSFAREGSRKAVMEAKDAAALWKALCKATRVAVK